MNDFDDPRALFGDQQLTAPDLLPLQTSMAMPPPAATSSQKQDAPLPVIPNGNLRDALMGKFDDPEVPSGIPDQGQQDQAFMHRAIGNGVGDAVNGIQNSINIIKPGAGNTHMGDANRQFGELLAQRALGNAEDRRKEAIQNFQLKDAADQRHEKMFQMATALKQQRDMQDSTSDVSRQAQAQEAARLDTLFAGAQDPAMQQNLMQRKAMLPSISASRLAASVASDPTEKLLAMASTERAAGAKLGEEKNKNASEAQRRLDETKAAQSGNALGWANLNEKTTHDRAEEAEKAKIKLDAKMNKDKSIEKDIADLMNTKAELLRHAENLSNGTVDNDKAHVYANQGKKFISSLGVPDISDAVEPDEALQDMLTSVPLAQGAVEKAVTGSSRYTPQRWTQFAVQEGEGTKNSINKLTAGARFLDELAQERRSQLDAKPDGTPASNSGLAQAMKPGAISKAAQHSADRAQIGAPSGAPKKLNQKQVDFLRTKAASGDADAAKMLKDAGL
jgi:hypothetical protein